MVSDSLARLLLTTRIPSPPAVAVRVIALARNPEVGLDEIAAAIAADPALAAKVIRLANSAAYARPTQARTIREAVLVLGMRTVKTLALGFSLAAELRGGETSAFDFDAIWRRCAVAAAASGLLARRVGNLDSGEAFLGGLLHGVGMLILGQALGPQFQDVLQQSRGRPSLQVPLERERLRTDHTEVAALVAEEWALPPNLRAALTCYAQPEHAPAEARDLARCIGTAVTAAEVLLGRDAQASLEAYRAECSAWWDLPQIAADELLSALQTVAGEALAMLDLPPGLHINGVDVLLQAREALEQVSLEAARAADLLEVENRQLSAAAGTDSLTGLANRRRFDEFLEDQCGLARRYGLSVSVLFLDLDRFKAVNDKHGHGTGDDVLIAVANALRATLRNVDLPARLGGDEFTVVLPGTGAGGAVHVADRVRRAVRMVGLGVTGSIGVASFERGSCEDGPALVRRADEAMYLAKETGPDAIRLARPAPGGTGPRAA
jgi:diguanylate cyclase (GGDEF)-like protein